MLGRTVQSREGAARIASLGGLRPWRAGFEELPDEVGGGEFLAGFADGACGQIGAGKFFRIARSAAFLGTTPAKISEPLRNL
jgi:hypothetical protein